MKRRGVLLALALAFVGLAAIVTCAGCGLAVLWAKRSGLPSPSRPTSGVTTLPRPERVGGGGELALSADEPVTLDPALVQDAYSAEYVVEIFSGLVTLDADLEVAPDLAEEWAVSEDGRTYTFRLRRGATFQDGRPVTAEDVRFSLERACSPELGSPAAPSYLNDIVGAEEMMRGEATEISGLRVIDERTLALTIDAPKAYFLAKLTYPTAFVVDRDNVSAGPAWTRNPNGTGPFRLRVWDDERIVLERNEYYYGDGPLLERVTFVLGGGDPVTMYENDQLDIAQVSLLDVERVQDPSNPLHRELTVVPRLDVQYLAMNVKVPPFDDLKVRQAVAHALDRQRLASVVWKKTVVPAQGILPPGLPGHDPELQGLAFDPDLARQRLGESRYGEADDLPEVVLHISGRGGTMPPTIEAIVAMLGDNLGLDVAVEQTPWDRFLDDLNARRYGLFCSGWIVDYPDPQNLLDILFHSRSGDNHSAYSNPEVDRLLEEARIEPEREKRLELYRQAEALIVHDAVWVPLWHGRDYTLTKPYVRGVVYGASIRPWLKDVYLER